MRGKRDEVSPLAAQNLDPAERPSESLLLQAVKTQRHQEAAIPMGARRDPRSEEHTSELQSPYDLVCRLLLEKKKSMTNTRATSTSPVPAHPPPPTSPPHTTPPPSPYTTLFRSRCGANGTRSLHWRRKIWIPPSAHRNRCFFKPSKLNGIRKQRFRWALGGIQDRKSTRLNSSHRTISYAVFCLKKKSQ